MKSQLVGSVVVLLGTLTSACSNGGATSTPTGPTGTTVQPVNYILRVEAVPGLANSVSFQAPLDRLRTDVGEVAVAVRVSGVQKVSGIDVELRWDPAKLTFLEWYKGGFLEQGGANVAWWSSKSNTTGYLQFEATRPSSLGTVDGTGDIVVLKFARKDAFVSGAVQLQWHNSRLIHPSCSAIGGGCNHLFVQFQNGSIAVAPE